MTGSHEVRGSIPLGSTNPSTVYKQVETLPPDICVRVPKVISGVRGLEISSDSLINQGASEAALSIF